MKRSRIYSHLLILSKNRKKLSNCAVLNHPCRGLTWTGFYSRCLAADTNLDEKSTSSTVSVVQTVINAIPTFVPVPPSKTAEEHDEKVTIATKTNSRAALTITEANRLRTLTNSRPSHLAPPFSEGDFDGPRNTWKYSDSILVFSLILGLLVMISTFLYMFVSKKRRSSPKPSDIGNFRQRWSICHIHTSRVENDAPIHFHCSN